MRMLRQALKFDGLVITDDMEMGAVVQTLTVAEASLRAIEAGSDMVLICEHEANFVAARDLLVESVKTGRGQLELITRANERIERLLQLAGAAEPFAADEFAAAARAIADLKRALEAADTTGEYAPVYGTPEGGTRRSSNF